MPAKTKIQWTNLSWNPVTGCTKTSPGCANCYAERMARRLGGRFGYPQIPDHFQVTLHPDRLPEPLGWRKPRLIFVCSMGDLFHPQVPDVYIQRVFAIMRQADQHIFQVLTKRSNRLADMSPDLKWPTNIWIGVSVETKDYIWRIDDLGKVEALVRFVSLEPLLGSITTLPLQDIHWIIVGGESGSKARPLKVDWVRDIRKSCRDAQVPLFIKQLGTKWGKARNTTHNKAGDPKEWPPDIRIREYPHKFGPRGSKISDWPIVG